MASGTERIVRSGRMLDVAALGLAALLLRVPFRADLLWAWDSILYARAVDDFHLGRAILEQRPQPPGYVLYVLAARAAAAASGDANTGIVAVSVVGGVLAVVAAYVFGRLAAGRAGGLAAGAIALASPVLWHGSEIAYPYALLAALSGILGLVFWWMRSGPISRALLGSAIFGVALGFRQDLLLYLGPLWLFVVAPRGLRAAFRCGLCVAGASLVWVVPSAAAAGGIDHYVALVSAQAAYASGMDDRPRALARNALLAANGLWWQLLWLWPLALAGVWWMWRVRPDLARHAAVWTAPGLVSFVAFHTGEPAYTLAVAVPLVGSAGVAVGRAATLPRRPIAVLGVAVCAGLVLALAATFVGGHGRYSAAAIQRHDEILSRQIGLIRSRYDPRDTVVLAQANYLHAVRYLGEYRAIYVAPRAEGGSGRRLARAMRGARSAILFDDSEPRLRRLARRIVLAPDLELFVIDVRGLRLAELDDDVDIFDLPGEVGVFAPRRP